MSILRFFLFPFSLIYACVIFIRNTLFNLQILHSKSHRVKLIVIGNLSTGGTGKSPLTLYLAELLNKNMNLSILSRGYGRKTKGFRWVEFNSDAHEVGDEPLMFKTTLGEHIPISVCENRNNGVENIQSDFPNTDVILLDDAFQHRKIKAGFSILLTTFDNPFFQDFLLPVGSLREFKSGASRSDLILVTKCPMQISIKQKKEFQNNLLKYGKPVFFAKVKYGELINFTFEIPAIKKCIVVTGIANPSGIIDYLAQSFSLEPMVFSDHHSYTKPEIDAIHQKFDTFATDGVAIVTTYKDYMRLKKNTEEWGLIKIGRAHV